jgi:Ca-activated chloride channel family protein
MIATLPTFSDADLRAFHEDPCKPEAGFGALTTAKGGLPLAALEVDARLDGLIAGIEVRQTFINSHSEPLEATYIFPLPDRAAVTSFRLEVAGRVVEGELQERGQARQQYDQAIRTGHRAAIAEEERPGVFTMRVGNLPPGERAVVSLTLVGPMPFSDGEVTFRFPLVVAPRYIPGTPLPGRNVGDGTSPDTNAVPDASRISPPVLLPGFPNPVALRLSVLVPESPLAPHDFCSSLHTVVEEEQGGMRRFRVLPGERLDRDFILRYRLDREQVQTALTIRPDTANPEEGTFLLTVLPPRGRVSAAPRDVIFVLDRSGSMGGWKMVAARRAVARMIDTLTEHDRFTVCAFDDNIETPPGFDGTTLATGNNHHRFRASEFLAGIDARGGTEMAAPLDKAVEELLRTGEPGSSVPGGARIERILVLITDGQVGNEDQILKRLGAKAKGIRIFTLGIDRAVNAGFLRRLADIGGGSSEVVESEERLDAVMDQVHRLIGTPVLTGLELRSEGMAVVSSLVPGRMPDLFAGAPLLLTGRYRGAAGGAIRLVARSAEGENWSSEVRAWKDVAAPLDRVWARGRVRELEDRYVIDRGGQAGLEREIVATSLRFGVLSRFTAFVAVDRAAIVNPGGEVKQVTQAVEQPAGWGQNATLAAAAPPPNVAGAMPMRSAPPGKLSLSRRPLSRPPAAAPAAPAGGMDALCCSAPEPMDTEAVESMLSALTPDAARDEDRAFGLRERIQRLAGPEQGGVMQRLLGLFGGRRRAKKPAPEPDRSPFRARVEAILAQLEAPAGDPIARLAQLRSVSAELEKLFRDLVTAGDRHESVERLGKEVVALQALLLQAIPDAGAVDQLYREIVAALRDWLALLPGGSPPAGRPREGFWK